MQGDAWGVLDAPYQIVGHGRGKPVAANQYVHMSRLAGKEHGCLACGIAATYHDHIASRAKAAFERRRGVVHALSLELRQLRQIQAAITRPGCDDDAAGRDRCSIVESEAKGQAAAIKSRG